MAAVSAGKRGLIPFLGAAILERIAPPRPDHLSFFGKARQGSNLHLRSVTEWRPALRADCQLSHSTTRGPLSVELRAMH